MSLICCIILVNTTPFLLSFPKLAGFSLLACSLFVSLSLSRLAGDGRLTVNQSAPRERVCFNLILAPQ